MVYKCLLIVLITEPNDKHKVKTKYLLFELKPQLNNDKKNIVIIQTCSFLIVFIPKSFDMCRS